jgi:hypothetical protein
VRGISSPQDYHSKKIIKSAPKKSLLIIWRDQLGAETPQTRIKKIKELSPRQFKLALIKSEPRKFVGAMKVTLLSVFFYQMKTT